MDLYELKSTELKRHPWETVRAKVLREILNGVGRAWEVDRVLDVGCGDGFTIGKVCNGLWPVEIDAVDINLTQGQIDSFSTANNNINFYSEFESLPHKSYQLITLFDVLEHVDNDAQFLSDIVRKFASGQQAKFFITVPAFNWLISRHDVSLKHRRRYSREMMYTLASENDLKIKEYGFVFLGLLPVRIMSLLWEKLTPNRKHSFQGVAQWSHGRIITKLVETFLYIDCWLVFKANKSGFKIPGLTLWFICEPLQ